MGMIKLIKTNKNEIQTNNQYTKTTKGRNCVEKGERFYIYMTFALSF